MKKFENFCRALNNLEVAATKNEYTELEETGFVAMFEICFELSWKVLKEVMEYEGFNKTASPREILKTAYAANFLDNNKIWLDILENRNILIHTYDKDKVKKTVDKIKKSYLQEFQKLKIQLDEYFTERLEQNS